MKIKNLLKERFQASPLYVLREWNELSLREKEIISGLHDEAEVYGIFSPALPVSTLSSKVAYRDLAFVYLHLCRAAFLPHYLTALPDDSSNNAIAQLVLDQVLELEWNGKFVSGVHATEALFGKSFSEDRQVPDRLSLLSKQGIEYALHFNSVDMRTLANKLYSYNTHPWDSSLKINFSDERDTRDFVFSVSRASLVSLLNKEWFLISDPAKDYWLGWTRRHFRESSPAQKTGNTYKLYLSPVIHDLPAVMAAALPVLTSSDAFSFKIGNGIQGLLRPDKMVAYFENKSSLLATAAVLKDKVSGFKVQGVPFTAQVDDEGILSWGVDPPGEQVLESVEGGSWRCKVTDQLALSILQAKQENLDHQQATAFINSRLFLNGISPFNWAPLN